MDDLVTWLRAQLDEDERVARGAIPGPWRWAPDPAHGDNRLTLMGQGFQPVVSGAEVDVFPHESTAAFIKAHDPARVLREVAAKRAIVEMHEAMQAGVEAAAGTVLAGAAKIRLGAYEIAVRHLAAVYADRPDYRPEWRP